MASKVRAAADPDTPARPTAFVSYAHGDDTWDATVLDFATALRTVEGIDADIDKWHLIDGQDWTTYGPAAIRRSDFTLLAVSVVYKRAWEGTQPPDRNAGAAREVATVKTIFDKDRHDFEKRVKVVVLPGASTEDIPDDLFATHEHFVVSSFDRRSLEPLVRSMRGKPPHEMPPLAPLPALPPTTGADTRIGPRSGGESRSEATEPAPEVGGGDRGIADWLTARLAAIEREIGSPDSVESAGVGSDGRPDSQLREERRAIQAALGAVERALPAGARRQRLVVDYLNAQLYFSAGAYRAADGRLIALRDRLSDPAEYPGDAVLEPCMGALTDVMLTLNVRMRRDRYAARSGHRHPKPPKMELNRHRTSGVREFYEVARGAMNDGSDTQALGVIRAAILRGRTPTDKHATGLYARYTEQQAIATLPLKLDPPSPAGQAGGAYLFAQAHLDGTADGVASDVLAALAKAHIDIHLVEHRRSGPVGVIMQRSKGEMDEDRALLRGSIVLNAFALSISETLPWIFAANEAERRAIQSDPVGARRDLSPARAMWPARQVTMLALYRRSHGLRLLGDHERAYNDLRMLQRVGRLTRLARPHDVMLTGWVDTLEALAEYRIGELYRADHDYMQALVHLCRSHDSVRALGDRPGSAIAKELGHLEIKLSLGKAKAFFEIGAMKRSLKWHLTAWRWLLMLQSPQTDLEERLVDAEETLDRVKHDLVLYKDDVQQAVAGVLEEMCALDLEPGHHALEADILVRISHLLTVLRLAEDGHDQPRGVGSSALRCMKRAAELDEHNLLVQTGMLRYEMYRPGSIANRNMPDPMECWPSGASDVDQVIRVAEHLMLARLHAAGGPTGMGREGVARALMGHLMTHTDSINLRSAILHRYLMRRRAEDRELWWSDADPRAEGARPEVSTLEAPSHMEFVCLRRFGSFTPFMPRPAAVSAVGGGYLVRIVRSATDPAKDDPRMFNIVVDPGEGAVNNLYAIGLSIADIDLVVATHDHPEHLSALDAILTLRKESEDREVVRSAADAPATRDQGARRRLLILGNRSVVNRYSILNGDGRHLVQHIADASVLGGHHLPTGVTIEQLETKHKDLGGHDASGFVLSFTEDAEQSDGPLRIAFMADTSIDGLRIDQAPGNPIDPVWDAALASDIVVAHVSDVPSGELRKLALSQTDHDEHTINAFDKAVKKLATARPGDASQLMHALSLVPPDPEADPGPVSLRLPGAIPDRDHLYLGGLLEVCERMSQVAGPAGQGPRVLIVGELKEQLGSFRGAIAREINTRILGLPEKRHGTAPPLITMTADIGLRIRLTCTTATDDADRRRITVLCSTCSYNNDRLDLERFHPPQDIYDVCIKGDHEALYWNCDLHDPGQRKRAMFIEQMGGYNPFAAGGRYHG